jgi:heavy metal sensor kinase
MRWPALRRINLRSLRTRFGLWVAVLVLVAVVVFGGFVYVSVGRGMRGSLADSLRVSASVVLSTVDIKNGKMVVDESLPTTDPDFEGLRAQGTTVRYVDTGGKVVAGFGPAWDSAPDFVALTSVQNGEPRFSEASDPVKDRDYLVYTVPVMAQGTVAGYIQVMRDFHSLRETLTNLLAALFAGGAAVVLLAGIGGYLLARKALAPVGAMTRMTKEISAGDLSARLNMADTYDEIGQLASSFDGMLERLEESFVRERRFTADASHELRTPLAAMEAILSVIRSEPRELAEYEEALDDLAEETARLRSLAEELLRLARGPRSRPAELEPVDLSLLGEDVVEAMRPLAEAKGLDLRCRIEAGLIVRADNDSLIRVFLNLLDNAIKFTQVGGEVTVAVYSRDGNALVEVSDTGIGIAANRLANIFERFYRADSSRSTPGAGLGLSLARQMVQDNGGELTVTSVEGQGSTFTVRLQRV